jgi:hypothetical protein
VGKYVDTVFDLLFKAVIVLVLAKVDLCPVSNQSAFADHITESVEELVRERDAIMFRRGLATEHITEVEESYKRRRMAVNNSRQRGCQDISIHISVIMTSALSLGDLKTLTQCV